MDRNLLARRVIALAAAYAIVLQALFSALAVTSPAAAANLCVGVNHESGGVPPASGHDCPACPLACGGGAPGLAGVATTPEIDLPVVSTALSLATRSEPLGPRDFGAGWARAPPA